MSRANDIAHKCGYSDAVTMITDMSTKEELHDLLCELLSESEHLLEITQNVAYDHFDYTELDEDAGESYHEWRDRLMDEAADRTEGSDDDMVGC